jgi:hypothetical protein
VRLGKVYVDGVSGEPERIRLCGEVYWGRTRRRAEIYWFEFPAALEPELSRSGNPWLACLLPLAVTVGEPLELAVPVDAVLLANVSELMGIWKRWYPYLSVVPVRAEPSGAAPSAAPGGLRAAFFSGGADSFFTALDWGDGLGVGQRGSIDELLCIWGFDIPIDDRASFLRLQASLRRAATDLGKALVDIATNLRRTRWRFADWELLAHGPALAATALCLEERYRTVFVPSTESLRYPAPWGSHFLTDPLFSTSRMAVRHDGEAFIRVEKLERIVGSEVALRALRVCFESRSERNCGRCEKCLRTMLALELLGALPHCPGFGAAHVELRRLKRLRAVQPYTIRHFLAIRSLGQEQGDRELVAAIDWMLARSERSRRLRLAAQEVKRCLVRTAARWQ